MAVVYAYAEDAAAQAAEIALAYVNPVAGITIPVGRRAVFHNMVFCTRKPNAATAWLCTTAIGAANHRHSLSILGTAALPGGIAGGDTYVYIDATLAAVPIILAHIGASAVASAVMLAGFVA